MFIFGHRTYINKVKKRFKKESDVGMLLTVYKAGKQGACRDAAHWYTKQGNKVHVHTQKFQCIHGTCRGNQ